MANIQIRVADNLHAQAQAVANSMGLDLPSVVRIFLTHMVRENGLPFRPVGDPFCSAQNQAHIGEVMVGIAEADRGEFVSDEKVKAVFKKYTSRPQKNEGQV